MTQIKKILYVLILLSLLVPSFFIWETWEITITLLGDVKSYLFTAGLHLGLLGGVLMWWQYVLGIRAISRFFTKDLLAVLDVHKNIGIYAMLIVFLHPLFLAIFYGLNDIYLFNSTFATTYDIHVKLGSTAFTFFLIIWLSSALLRKKLGFRTWKLLHFLSYLIFPLVYLHAREIGVTLNTSDYIYIWDTLFISFLILTVYRIVFQAGISKYQYEIVNIVDEARDIVKIELKAKGAAISKYVPGQFAYITRKGFFRESHPFTISGIDHEEKTITFIFKKLGKWTRSADMFQIGEVLDIDGPYGIFLKDMKNYRNIVFYGGGIGITPFIESTKVLLEQTDSHVTLFYGTRTADSLVHADNLEQLAKDYPQRFNLIYLLSDEQDPKLTSTNIKIYSGRQLDSEIISLCVPGSIQDCFHAICGPKPFMDAIYRSLRESGVTKEHIDRELFSY